MKEVTKDLQIKIKGGSNIQKNIIILAGGPPKKNRNRYLEKFDNKILISTVIDACNINNIPIYIVLNKTDLPTQNFVKKNHSNVNILLPRNEKWLSSMESFSHIKGDIILVCGDTINLRQRYIQSFIDTNYRFAINKLKYPWGAEIIKSPSGKTSQNGTIALDIILIGNEFRYLLYNPDIINETQKMADDWNRPSINTGVWGGFQMLTIIKNIGNNVKYINRDEENNMSDND